MNEILKVIMFEEIYPIHGLKVGHKFAPYEE